MTDLSVCWMKKGGDHRLAITKLMHMKEAKTGPAFQHLKNSLEYILNSDKTENGLWVGGNAGSDPEEVLYSMLATKHKFDKNFGRQGYHFVISFEPGECTEETAFNVISQWCEAYLGDAYDHVFAIHNDQSHMHGHIVFNSINRIDGYKYRYVKGAWEKYIQPVTDKACRKYHLQPLRFEEGNRIGMHRVEWNRKQEHGISHADIVKADIDLAVRDSSTYEEFKQHMRSLGYEITREGFSKKNGSYLSFRHESFKAAVRTDRLPESYSVGSIKRRILLKTQEPELKMYETVSHILMLRYEKVFIAPEGVKQTRRFKRLDQAVQFYHLANPYAVSAKRVKKDLLRCNDLVEEVNYLKSLEISSLSELNHRLEDLRLQKSYISGERFNLEKIYHSLSDGQKQKMKEYEALKEDYDAAYEKKDDSWESLEDRLQDIRKELPEGLAGAEDKLQELKAQDKTIWREQKLIERILENEEEREPE